MDTSKLRHILQFSLSLVLISFLLSACDTTGHISENPSSHEFVQPGNTDTSDSNQSSGDVGAYSYVVEQNRLNVLVPAAIDLQGDMAYPKRDVFNIKAVYPDFWTHREDFGKANTGGVSVNLVWKNWERQLNTSVCNTATQIKYDGHCFSINSSVEDEIKYFTSQGIIVTAIVWGVPDWAYNQQTCQPLKLELKQFCATENENDFARFTGMIAHRYNGKNGNGRIADFVIHNEVNMNDWYNVGCAQGGAACDVDSWIAKYAKEYNAAYDVIKTEQVAAKIFVPFAHQFDETLQQMAGNSPVIAVKTFLRKFNTLTAGRKWRVAYHPYAINLFKPDFSADDFPHVTYGNIGVLAGWLRSEFRNQPEAWEIQLTESGINSLNNHSSEIEQVNAICDSFRNILATPGIENYVYHRMQDHIVELNAGAAFGLHNADGTAKQAWNLWSNISGRNGQRNNLDCGFENGNSTLLTQYSHKNRLSWASTRIPPTGYNVYESWRLLRDYEANTVIVYECANDDGSYVSSDVACGGSLNLGPLGYLFAKGQQPNVPLFSCKDGDDRYVSTDATCGGFETVEFLGYASAVTH